MRKRKRAAEPERPFGIANLIPMGMNRMPAASPTISKVVTELVKAWREKKQIARRFTQDAAHFKKTGHKRRSLAGSKVGFQKEVASIDERIGMCLNALDHMWS